MEEIWKDIPGFEGYYQASNTGLIKSISEKRKRKNKSRILKLSTDLNGYLSLFLNLDGIKTRHRVHRLIAISFLPNKDGKPNVNHKNGIKNDNRIGNLEWLTRSENNRHAVDNGLIKTGDKSIKSRIKSKEICQIRELYLNNEMTVLEIKDRFNISIAHCYRVINFERRRLG